MARPSRPNVAKASHGAAPPRRHAWIVVSILGGLGIGLAVLSFLLLLPSPTAPRSAPPPSVAAATTPSPAATTSSAAPAAAASAAPSIKMVDCWFAAPAGHAARCGVLSVPEQWGN